MEQKSLKIYMNLQNPPCRPVISGNGSLTEPY